VRRYELWAKDWDSVGGGGSQSFFDENNARERKMAHEGGMELVWEVTAVSPNSAMQAMYDYRGWGTYKPMSGPDGTPYPDDEYEDLKLQDP
jgi:hypothetical protein